METQNMPPLTTKTKTKVGTKVAVALLIVGGAVAAALGIPKLISRPVLTVRLPDLQLFGEISVTNANFSCVMSGACRVGDIYGSIQIANVGGRGTVRPFTIKLVMQRADGSVVPIRVWSPGFEDSLDFNAAIKTPGFTQSETVTPVRTIVVAVPALTGDSAQGPRTFIEIPAIISRSYINNLGATQLVVKVDDGDTNIESNEDNNIKVYNLPPPDLSFALSPASAGGAGAPGVSEVLRFTVTANPRGDVFIRHVNMGASGTDRGSTRWPENEAFWRSWRLYEASDLSTPIGSLTDSRVSVQWDGTSWKITRTIELGEIGLLISAGTTKTLVLKVDTTGASSASDDQVRFDVNRVNWLRERDGVVYEAVGRDSSSLVIGNTINY